MLDKRYDHVKVEEGKYEKWKEGGYFKAGDQSKQPFSLVIPPPNVTGKLHLGHVMDTIPDDIIARYKRMKGFDVLWVPGVDHAGIATQAKVEERLREQGVSRYDLGREKFLEKAFEWKREYSATIHNQWASIGLSGGIDSAVVASLAVDALGADRVHALLMPSPFSSDASVEDAKRLAANLGIGYNVIPISEIYTSVVNTLKPVIGGLPFDSTEENIQTRIRTVLLMALQNKTGYVLLNSSNKSENALGLCTLYGDTAGAFSPTGDLYKSEIYDVARYINRTQGNPIPESILTKEPSSELHPGQKDSDILPPYEVVDAILFRMIEEGQHREEIVNAGFDAEVVERIHSMIMRNEKKRYQFPPVLRLSSCSFGHERLMPLTNKYGD